MSQEIGVAGVAGVAVEARKGFWIKKEGNFKFLKVTFYIGTTKIYEISTFGESNIRELLIKISSIEKNLDKFIEGSTVIANGTKNVVISSVSFIVSTGRSIIGIGIQLKKIHDFLSKPPSIEGDYDECDQLLFGIYPRDNNDIDDEDIGYFSCDEDNDDVGGGGGGGL
jgi:hypothetical protein